MITQKYLKEYFIYKDGHLLWNKINYKSNRKIGDKLGTVNNLGYRICGLRGKIYLVHRLIWLYHFNELPKEIDHIDGNKANNDINNLRPALREQNVFNSTLYSKGTSTGIKGIYWDKKANLYQAQVVAYGKRHRKCFKSLEEAKSWLQTTRETLHGEFTNHGNN